ncbi:MULTISPECIES: DUF3137 domain-containing protein [unclassified Campylobacter]|uniref:DUF3137 domain-containing protein n=1 Tax=unclassified Campylobacter TaxID=2593542 RepID=UPI001DE362DD|nr:DUF3137 domain-containing protein [Campylobacter sp. RM12651]MBZ7990830.1 DUF3137 domain-containing protein [Campylobacter sp. RM9331]MBZ8005358.1 DUF3137 domain-containing protein [Campylobacter sp. RM9332]ULO03191.1 putative membrane protein [Campylobacter sp. RM12651]
MIKTLKLIFIVLVVFAFYKLCLAIDDYYISKDMNLTHFSHFLYLMVSLILLALLIYTLNLFLYVLPFFYKHNFVLIEDKEKYKDTLIASDRAYIFNAYRKNGLDILFCSFLKVDSIGMFDVKIKYLSIDFFGTYIRVKKKIHNNFGIFANRRLLFLYFNNGILFNQKISYLSDNVEFNKKFILYPSDMVKDFKFLNPKKLRNIVTAAKYINHRFSVIYGDEYLEIYIHNFLFSSNIENEFKSVLRIIKEFNEAK